MYKNIIGAIYRFYDPYKTRDPYFSAIIIVAISQQILLFFIVAIFKKYTEIDLFGRLTNKYYFIPIYIIWPLLLFKLFPKDKVKEFADDFALLSEKRKAIWNIVTISSIILPLLGFISTLK